ncbi:hypothetical protein CEXT_70551 [Caerostris extrusa]|uniref:Uncharacterized protein n=1 Tax=Caerostris extrusa TaxID=172846 RepID=A0AAV4R4R1_CAEEX|nr:hypothetical protein CEXT_70551 [Caerostris extrusa]
MFEIAMDDEFYFLFWIKAQLREALVALGTKPREQIGIRTSFQENLTSRTSGCRGNKLTGRYIDRKGSPMEKQPHRSYLVQEGHGLGGRPPFNDDSVTSLSALHRTQCRARIRMVGQTNLKSIEDFSGFTSTQKSGKPLFTSRAENRHHFILWSVAREDEGIVYAPPAEAVNLERCRRLTDGKRKHFFHVHTVKVTVTFVSFHYHGFREIPDSRL